MTKWRFPKTPATPGMIAVCSGNLTRYPKMWLSLATVEKPAGTILQLSQGAGIAQNRNASVRAFLQTSGEWIWFMDDDHTFESPKVLQILLAMEKDIAAPLVLRREPPHATVAYDRFTPKEAAEAGKPWGWHAYRLDPAQTSGSVKVLAVGTGGMLIRRRVIEALEDPWFEVGQLRTEELSEDLWFCEKARRKGFEVWMSLDARISHVTPVAVWPVIHDGEWHTGYDFGVRAMPLVPALTTTHTEEEDRQA